MIRYKIAAVWVGLQVLFFVAWAGIEQSRLAQGEGQSIVVKTAPVDPRDLLSGQFIRLSYEFSRLRALEERSDEIQDGNEVWVVLAPSKEERAELQDGESVLHEFSRVSGSPPDDLGPGQIALKGHRDGRRFVFGIERYFVPEGSPTPDRNDIRVRLRVGQDGQARIEQVYVKGVSWP